jgi:hypothetical protein
MRPFDVKEKRRVTPAFCVFGKEYRAHAVRPYGLSAAWGRHVHPHQAVITAFG